MDDKVSAISGINIEEAKKFLENERQYDKELEKARIKRKHTETRIKEKELRRAKRQKVKLLKLNWNINIVYLNVKYLRITWRKKTNMGRSL